MFHSKKYVLECDILKDNENNIINPFGTMINDLYGIAETKEEINFVKDSVNKYIGKMMNPEKQKIIYKENLKCSNVNDLKLMFKNDMDKLYTGDLDDVEINKKIDENLSYDDVLKLMFKNDMDKLYTGDLDDVEINKKIDENLSYDDVLKLMFKNDMDKLYTGDLDDVEINKKIDENLSYDDVLKLMTLRNDIGYIEDTQNKNMVWHWNLKEKNNMYVGQDNKPLHILIRDIA